jgi:hypothetical protein
LFSSEKTNLANTNFPARLATTIRRVW